MTNKENPSPTGDADPIDREAATIDARDDDAPEEIAELVEHAHELGRDVDPSTTAAPKPDADDAGEGDVPT